jgi:hypothetical protein
MSLDFKANDIEILAEIFSPDFELKNLICKFGDAFVHNAGFKRRNFVILGGGCSEGGKRSAKHVEIV